jgi:hypothetical protein
MKEESMKTSVAAAIVLSLLIGGAPVAVAQVPEADARQTVIEEAQAQKSESLQPYVPSTGERLIGKVENAIVYPSDAWHPFLDSAYRGGGFALGAGYMQHVSAYSSIDFRGSYSIRNYKRVEAEFISPRVFHRRGHLSVLGGWGDATEVAFYGIGTDASVDNRANYGFERPYASALLTLQPTRRLLMVRGGLEVARWALKSGAGADRSIEDVYTPAQLAGLLTTTTYVHSQGTIGFDWRTSPGYARRGGFYGVTLHDYSDRDDTLGFRQADYELIQHVPILREAWVVSLRGLVETTWNKKGQDVPFFMLPSLGGGSNLRGFSSWRFRDRHSMLLQAEWRIMANRYFETAVFYDAGKVARRTADLDFDGLKSDYGFGARFHTPFSTALRVDVARSNEGTRLVFAISPVF